MGTLVRLCEAGTTVAIRRRQAGLNGLWDRMQARARRVEAQAVAEREEAAALLAELRALPAAGERLETVEREPRFWTLGMAEHLLATAATAKWVDAAGSAELAELALALVRRLEPQGCERSLVFEQEVVAWSLWAEAHRRQGDFVRAESGFRAASRRLASEPLEIPERGTFCRTWRDCGRTRAGTPPPWGSSSGRRTSSSRRRSPPRPGRAGASWAGSASTPAMPPRPSPLWSKP